MKGEHHLFSLGYSVKSILFQCFCILSILSVLTSPGLYAAPTCDVPTGQFCVNYYDNVNLSGTPFLQEYEVSIDHDWEHSGPRQFEEENQFSARWQGQFSFEDGEYDFNIHGDDGIRVWVDGQLILDEWRDQDERFQLTAMLTEGIHTVRVEYFDSWWVAGVAVDWRRKPGRHVPGPQVVPYIPLNTDNANSPLGTNTVDVNYYQTRWLFVDAMKRASHWLTQCADWMADGCSPQAPASSWDTQEQAQLDLDENGWVRSLPAADDANVQYRWVSKYMYLNAGGHYPAGRYTVLYDGEGTLEYDLDAVKNNALSVPGRDVFEVNNPTDMGIMVMIMATDPEQTGNYIRNIRVILPGGLCDNNTFSYCDQAACDTQGASCTRFEDVYEAQIFHPRYLQSMRRYKAVRLMNLLSITEGSVANLAGSPKLTDHRWSTFSGVPIEIVLDLPKRLNADAWITIPARTDNDYVAEFARQALATLHPTQNVYLEYHNEVWNPGMPFEMAGSWVEARGQEEWPDATLRALFDLPDDFVVEGVVKRLNWYGKRSVEICHIWKNIWRQSESGDQSSRILCTMSGQMGSEWATRQALDCPLWAETTGQTCASSMDVLAVGSYFGYYLGTQLHENQIMAWLQTPETARDNLFQELEFGGLLYDEVHPVDERAPQLGSLSRLEGVLTEHAQIAAAYGLKFSVYEGGQHLAFVNDPYMNPQIGELFNESNRDPRMAGLYDRVFEIWNRVGGGLFMHFNHIQGYNPWISFGAMEYHGQDSPKYDALMRYITDNPTCIEGC